MPSKRRSPPMTDDDSLRSRAESKAKKQKAWMEENDPGKLSPPEMRAIIAELHVHQIELEMRNQELRAHEELVESKVQYFDHFDTAPVAYLTLDGKGLIGNSNLTAASLLGKARGALINVPLSRFVALEDQEAWFRFRAEIKETG